MTAPGRGGHICARRTSALPRKHAARAWLAGPSRRWHRRRSRAARRRRQAPAFRATAGRPPAAADTRGDAPPRGDPEGPRTLAEDRPPTCLGLTSTHGRPFAPVASGRRGLPGAEGPSIIRSPVQLRACSPILVLPPAGRTTLGKSPNLSGPHPKNGDSHSPCFIWLLFQRSEGMCVKHSEERRVPL